MRPDIILSLAQFKTKYGRLGDETAELFAAWSSSVTIKGHQNREPQQL